jgi:hypothetical protein
LASRADEVATTAIVAVVAATCGVGRNCSTAPISSYKVTHIFAPSGFLGSTCNSNPLTFSV